MALFKVFNIVNDDKYRVCFQGGSFGTMQDDVNSLMDFIYIDDGLEMSAVNVTDAGSILNNVRKLTLFGSRNPFDSRDVMKEKFAVLNDTGLQNVRKRREGEEASVRGKFLSLRKTENEIVSKRPGNEVCVEGFDRIKRIFKEELDALEKEFVVIDRNVGSDRMTNVQLLNKFAYGWATQYRITDSSESSIAPIPVEGSRVFNIACPDMAKFSLSPIDVFHRVAPSPSIPYSRHNGNTVLTNIHRDVTKISLACPPETLTSKRDRAFFSVTDKPNPSVRSDYALFRVTSNSVFVRMQGASEKVYDVFTKASGINIDKSLVTEVSNTFMFPEISINKDIFFAMMKLSPTVAPLILHRDTGNTNNAPSRFPFRFTKGSMKIESVTADSVTVEITSGTTQTNNELALVVGFIMGQYPAFAADPVMAQFFEGNPAFGGLSKRRDVGSGENDNKVEKLKSILGANTITPMFASQICQCEKQPISFRKENFSPEFVHELATTFKRDDGISYSVTDMGTFFLACPSKIPHIRTRTIGSEKNEAPCCSRRELETVPFDNSDDRPLMMNYPFSRHPAPSGNMDALLYGVPCSIVGNPKRIDIDKLIDQTGLRRNNVKILPEFTKVDMPDILTLSDVERVMETAVPDILLMHKFFEKRFDVNIYIVESANTDRDMTFVRPLNMIHHHRVWKNRKCIIVSRTIVNTKIPIHHELVSVNGNIVLSEEMDMELQSVFRQEIISSKIVNGVIVRYENNVLDKLKGLKLKGVMLDNYGFIRILVFQHFTIYTDPIDSLNIRSVDDWSESEKAADDIEIVSRLGEPTAKNSEGLWFGDQVFVWGAFREDKHSHLTFRRPPHKFTSNLKPVIPDLNKLKEYSKYLAWIINQQENTRDKVIVALNEFYEVVDRESRIPDKFFHRDTMPTDIDDVWNAIRFSWPGLLTSRGKIKITAGMKEFLMRYMNSMVMASPDGKINLDAFSITIVDRLSRGTVRFSSLFAYSGWLARINGSGSNKVMNSSSTFNMSHAGRDFTHPFLSTVTIERDGDLVGIPCLVQRVFNFDKQTAIAVSLSWLREKINPGIFSNIIIPQNKMNDVNVITLSETDNLFCDTEFRFDRASVLKLNDESFVAILVLEAGV